MPARCEDAAASVAESVIVVADRDFRVRDHMVRLDQVGRSAGMGVQHQDHRRRLEALVGQLIADADVHAYSPTPKVVVIGSTPPTQKSSQRRADGADRTSRGAKGLEAEE